MENSIKSISTINPAIMKKIWKVGVPGIDQNMGVSLDHGVSLHFAFSYFECFR